MPTLSDVGQVQKSDGTLCSHIWNLIIDMTQLPMGTGDEVRRTTDVNSERVEGRNTPSSRS
jgi:hypothetical protein